MNARELKAVTDFSYGLAWRPFPNCLLITEHPVCLCRGIFTLFHPHLASLEVCLLPSHCLILHIPSCDLCDPHGFDWHSFPEGCQLCVPCTILLSLSFRSVFDRLQDISPWASPKHPSSSCPKVNSWCLPPISSHCLLQVAVPLPSQSPKQKT